MSLYWSKNLSACVLCLQFPAFLKLEWRQASPDAARIFSRLATLKVPLLRMCAQPWSYEELSRSVWHAL